MFFFFYSTVTPYWYVFFWFSLISQLNETRLFYCYTWHSSNKIVTVQPQLLRPLPSRHRQSHSSHAASSTDSSLARMPPILLKAGIWMPYFSNSLFMLLISSSVRDKATDGVKLSYSQVKKSESAKWSLELTCEIYFSIKILDLRGQTQLK